MAGQGGDRPGHPADPAVRRPQRPVHDRRHRDRRRRPPGRHAPGVPRDVRPDRAGHPLRDPAPRVPALPEAQPGIPRRLHVRAGDLAPDVRHGRALRDARVRLRRPGDRRPHAARHRRTAAGARREAGPGRAALLPVPALAHQLVPSRVGRHLPRHPREGRARHRPLRRVDGRHPRRPGVPPRAAQPGDLRRRQRPVPPRQPAGVPPGRVVHARYQADRQRHHRRRPRVRRLPRERRRDHDRRAGRVPALPAPVLRADAGDLAVLQHVPVGDGCAGEAVGRARGGAVGGRAGEAHPAAQPAR